MTAVYGALAYYTDSIWPSLVLHAGGNMFSAFDLFTRGRSEWELFGGSQASDLGDWAGRGVLGQLSGPRHHRRFGGLGLLGTCRCCARMIRVAALVLLAAAILFVLSLNLSYYDTPWHTLGFNQTFGSFVLLIGALVSGAWYYAKTKEIGDDERKVAFCGLIGAANVLAVIALSAEALGYFDRAQLLASGELVSSST